MDQGALSTKTEIATEAALTSSEEQLLEEFGTLLSAEYNYMTL
ncbi:hypothetical protein [Nonomuraea mesophila]|nr:hypothetical protein [Nonomuraea mesophila]